MKVAALCLGGFLAAAGLADGAFDILPFVDASQLIQSAVTLVVHSMK